jgi:hypothetical protein
MKKYFPSHNANQFASLMSLWHTAPEFEVDKYLHDWYIPLLTHRQNWHSSAITWYMMVHKYEQCTVQHSHLPLNVESTALWNFYLFKIYCPWQHEDFYYISQGAYCSLTSFHTLILSPTSHAHLSTHVHQTVQTGLWQLTNNSQHIQAELKYLHNFYTTKN